MTCLNAVERMIDREMLKMKQVKKSMSKLVNSKDWKRCEESKKKLAKLEQQMREKGL